MKSITLLVIGSCLLFLFQGCFRDKLTHTYTILVPVYKTKTEVYANVKSNTPREIDSPGKLFLYGKYIFLNEINKGVHVIDNSDPSHPVPKTFIDIPGNLDIAVKGNTLYADLYSDLVVVDISDPLHARFVKYLPGIFPDRRYPGGFVADASRIIVGWEKKDTTVDLLSSSRNFIRYDLLLRSSIPAASGGISVPGIAGSMARFSVVNNYLYCLNNSMLNTFNLDNPGDPQQVSGKNVGWNIETIFPLGDKLFIGSTIGMFIYDISNPESPVQLNQFSHARSCDPVIADNENAYITLHDGTPCGGFSNQLDVVNISNLSSPSLINSYPMTHPEGLAKDKNLLFICDGRDGLKMYDAANPSDLVLKKQISGIETYDAIAWNGNLIVVAKDGLYQFDYSSPGGLLERSKLIVNR